LRCEARKSPEASRGPATSNRFRATRSRSMSS
jgi:hypothetical protein